MTLILPIEMPLIGGAQQYFEPVAVSYQSPEQGGRIGSVQAGPAKWEAEWSIGRIGARASDEWRAWVARIRLTSRPFMARDRARPFPLRYPQGFVRMTLADEGGPFLGAASGWSQEIDAQGDALLTLEGLPSGLILSVGDYVGFRWDAAEGETGNMARRALVRCETGSMADASGDVTVRVVPPVPVAGEGLMGVVPSDAIAHLDRPACVMKMPNGDRPLGPIDRRLAITGGTIKAMQELMP